MKCLLQLTENDKRVLIAVCLVFILLFVLIGYIAMLVKRFFNRQASRVDDMMFDVVKTKVVKDTKHFKKVAFHKSRYLFFKQAWIPVLLMSIAGLILGIYCLCIGSGNIHFLFSRDEGFPTLFFIFDWSNVPKSKFFGISIPCDWPPILVTAAGRKCVPTFLYKNANSWISYIVIPLFLTGFIWYLITGQALLARTLRINKMSKDVFSKKLETLSENPDVNPTLQPKAPTTPTETKQ